MISMQKDLSTVSFVYLAASALDSDCVYLINVYKAKRKPRIHNHRVLYSMSFVTIG